MRLSRSMLNRPDIPVALRLGHVGRRAHYVLFVDDGTIKYVPGNFSVRKILLV